MTLLLSFLAPLTVLLDTVTFSWDDVINAITSQISVSNVATALAAAVAICIAFVWFWWGARKVARMIMSAFKKGRISL